MNLVVESGKFDILIDISSTNMRLEESFEIVGEEKELEWSRKYFTETRVE